MGTVVEFGAKGAELGGLVSFAAISDTGEGSTVNDRLYCPLAPCLPSHEGRVNNATVAMSAPFATHEAYWRHIERGHFIARANGPLPYIVVEDEEAVA